MRVALVHDYLTQTGGAERVVLSLQRIFPQAPVYTTVYDPAGTYPEFAGLDVRTSFLQALPHAGRWSRALLPLYPAAVESRRLSGYDLVISSSSGWAHGTRVAGGFHLSYCYTPARWLYQTSAYLERGGPLPAGVAPAMIPLLGALRRWDRRAGQRPDAIVTMTAPLAERIASAWGRSALVLAPPLDLERISRAPSGGEGGHYLVVARLLPYKRVDLAIRACAARGERLVVVGDGPARSELLGLVRSLGSDTAFVGRADDADLAVLLGSCRALIQAGEEDFGLGPLEANAAGRPALALARGGALATVDDGRTGVLFGEPTVESLSTAMARAESIDWDPGALRRHALSYSEDAFRRGLLEILESLGVVGAASTSTT